MLAETFMPASMRAFAHDRPGAERVDDAGARREEPADDQLLVDEGDFVLDLLRGEHLDRFDAPRPGRHDAPAQFLHPLLGPRDLDPAALDEHPEILVLAHALERQQRHLLRVVDREDEVRRVSGRPAGVRQRSLVDHRQVRHPEAGEVVRQAVADDPGPDHDYSLVVSRAGHACSVPDISDGCHDWVWVAGSVSPWRSPGAAGRRSHHSATRSARECRKSGYTRLSEHSATNARRVST